MRNKIIASVAFMFMFSSFAYAVTGIPLTTAGGKPFTFKLSNNVSINYTVDGTGQAAQNYAVVTKNAAGNRLYASANNTSNIFYLEDDGNKGKDVDASTYTGGAKPSAGVFVSAGWTSQ